VEGVDVPVDVGTGVEAPEVAAELVLCRGSSMATVMSVAVVDVSLGAVPPRSGESMCKVVAGCRPKSVTVLEGDRWRPECSNRTSEGRVVDADRKSRTSEMVFDGLTFRGMVLPPLMATNIWMLSAGSDWPEVEEVAEDDRERMITKVERRRWRWLR